MVSSCFCYLLWSLPCTSWVASYICTEQIMSVGTRSHRVPITGHPSATVPFCRYALEGGGGAPLCDIPSSCGFFAGPWTVTRSSLRVLRSVAAF